MREEFEIAKEKGLFLLPIVATGYMAKELWDEVNSDFKALNGGASKKINDCFTALGDESLSFEAMFENVMKILTELKNK